MIQPNDPYCSSKIGMNMKLYPMMFMFFSKNAEKFSLNFSFMMTGLSLLSSLAKNLSLAGILISRKYSDHCVSHKNPLKD